jgi:hypothetical protein
MFLVLSDAIEPGVVAAVLFTCGALAHDTSNAAMIVAMTH